MLHKRYGIKPMIFIDDYDTPVLSAYTYGYYEEMTTFLCNLFCGAYKDKPNLSHGFVAKVIVDSECFSTTNNLLVDTVLDEMYSGAFGFREDEARFLFCGQAVRYCYGKHQRWAVPFDTSSVLAKAEGRVLDELSPLERGESLRVPVSLYSSLDEATRKVDAMLGFLLMTGKLNAEDISLWITGERICTFSRLAERVG